jgi:hypothetical protein
MTNASPPRWAEAVLRLVLPPQDRQSVSGDLLEAYRDSVVPDRGQAAADRWYLGQVAGFVWRTYAIWAVVLSAAFLARTALDWLVPTTDFRTRSAVTTYATAAIFVCAGCWAAWRSRSLVAAAFAAGTTGLMSAVIDALGSLVLLALWHDRATLAAIDGSGGLEEVFVLPLFILLPGILLGAFGGVVGCTMRKLASPAR